MKIIKDFFIKSILFLLLPAGELSAQVTFGMTEDPEEGALIEVKTKTPAAGQLDNADKGVLFSKVSLVKFDALAPLNTNPSAAEKLKATGMLVYNTNANAEGIDVGFAEWNGSAWVRPGDKMPPAAFTIDCSGIAADGYYNKMRWLTPWYNTLTVPVDVTRAGIYDIRISAFQDAAANTSEGFSYTLSGEFISAGPRTITLSGEGRPIKSTAEIGSPITLKATVNGKDVSLSCSPTVQVDGPEADFIINCASLKQTGTYKTNTPMAADNALLVGIISTASGGEYIIETEDINGIKFKAKGILTGTNQTVTLEPVPGSRPTSNGIYTYTLKYNSTGLESPCSIDIVFSN